MDGVRPQDLSRRKLIGGTAVGAAAMWAAPSVTTLGLSKAAAASATGYCPGFVISAFDGATTFTDGGQLTSGADLTENNASPWSNDATGYVFSETGPVQLPAAGYQSETAFIPGGTWVCSIYIHGSPTSRTSRYRMTLTIPGATVLGYDGRDANLSNSDPLFAVAGVDYNGGARSHEWNGNSGGSGDYFGQTAADTVEVRMAVANCCVDHGRLFVSCL